MVNSPRASSEQIVAISLLTREELRNVGTGLRRVYHLPEGGDNFDDLLKAIERKTRRH